MKSVVVIGSGISGLSISRMLSDKYKVEIVEKNQKSGGLIKCERINGNLFHRVGGHVFNSRNKVVLDWFWSHFDKDKEFLSATRNAKIKMNDELIGYPIENHLYQLPEEQMKLIVNELLDKLTDEKIQTTDYANFKDFLVGNFGEELYKIYFGPYNTKVWNADLSKVPLEWLDGKLPMPKLREVLLNNIIKKEESTMVHSTFFYPRRDGSQFIINRLSEGLNINCSYQVESIKYTKNKGLSINNESKFVDSIVYCGDIRELGKVIQIKDDALQFALNNVKNLVSNGTSNVLCETDENDLSWLYLPEEKFKAHRIIYTGNFSETNNEGSKRKTCVVEFSGKQSKTEMTKELSYLPGNLIPLAFNYEPNSYIIQNHNTREKITTLKSLLKPYGIFLLGRFAEWEYYNMDKCIEKAMQLNEENF
ncbi:protoporphyrinogen/coproporphyrinogen oxidase [Christiangramia salexigens]|uniref:UDP-galactopyranose mutase n=1 Tax=Christiangramia salexigens TaxID=1913577 RepID=A0A1L3J5Q4_9FLAO|nr:NAD(P)-binding protein [Christiangramia salexigens]APG60430.1 UDP-galactopyranose mutase [Christiangramia salexigens]